MVKENLSCSDCGDGTTKKTAASKIFDTAKDLFYKRGVRAVGVDEIVCEAGVTKPSLYRAYKSKDDLVAACLQENAIEAREAIQAAIDAAGPCPRDRLRALISYYSDKISCPEFRGCLISNVAIELPEPGHPGRGIVQDCKTEFRAIVGDLTRDLCVCDPDALADGLVLVIEGAMATHHVFGSQGPALALVCTCNSLIESHLERVKG
ncbi:MAG TPA: TetR/AcrR family transcriptional regulator [Sphingobium sp.]|uniref:TetR/AcrR family transcriptional regulator n=1 Tax=Sphingobium sp. TaxID=1912891 RepID=UPI002ED4E74E